jgi:hypothetical protein
MGPVKAIARCLIAALVAVPIGITLWALSLRWLGPVVVQVFGPKFMAILFGLILVALISVVFQLAFVLANRLLPRA